MLQLQKVNTNKLEMDDGDPKTDPEDESGSSSWESNSTSGGSSLIDRDDSFDHVLDVAFPSNGDEDASQQSNLCEYCQNLVDELPRIGRMKRDETFTCDTLLPHVRGPLALQDSAEAGCTLCSAFLSTFSGTNENYRAEIAEYVEDWRARFGETPFPRGEISLQYQDWKVNSVPKLISLDFPVTNDDGPECGPIAVDLKISAMPRELRAV